MNTADAVLKLNATQFRSPHRLASDNIQGCCQLCEGHVPNINNLKNLFFESKYFIAFGKSHLPCSSSNHKSSDADFIIKSSRNEYPPSNPFDGSLPIQLMGVLSVMISFSCSRIIGGGSSPNKSSLCMISSSEIMRSRTNCWNTDNFKWTSPI